MSAKSNISIGRVVLTTRDLPAMSDFYQRVLGLSQLSGEGKTVTLGAGERPLVELREDKAARSRPNEAGLFHTAFLLPTRADLGSWLHHAGGLGLRLEGASDHLVSEALYLRDPEGNGIEIYRDRPREEWDITGDQVRMDTLRLDLNALPHDGVWQGAPEGTTIGHVHLQVGDLTQAHEFFTDDLGLTRTFHMPTAGWYGWDGYHHHLAGNIWNSRGAGRRTPGAAGLSEVELLAPTRVRPRNVTDPFGTQFAVKTRT